MRTAVRKLTAMLFTTIASICFAGGVAVLRHTN